MKRVFLVTLRIGSQAGEAEIDRDFCRQARSLDSLHPKFEFIWLDALSRIAAEEELAAAIGVRR